MSRKKKQNSRKKKLVTQPLEELLERHAKATPAPVVEPADVLVDEARGTADETGAAEDAELLEQDAATVLDYLRTFGGKERVVHVDALLRGFSSAGGRAIHLALMRLVEAEAIALEAGEWPEPGCVTVHVAGVGFVSKVRLVS